MPREDYDYNNDNVVSVEELERAEMIARLDRNEERFQIHKRMAWTAFFMMIFFTGMLFLPFLSIGKVAILTELVTMLYFSMAGVIASFMGSTAWMEVGTPKVSVNSRMPNSSRHKSVILEESGNKVTPKAK